MKMNFSKWLAVLSMLGLSVASFVVFAINPDPNLSLKNEPRPEPPDLMTNYVTDKQALIALGKSLFWDMQVGGDGIQACASCHFLAGADSRAKNQITPGLLGANVDASPNPDLTFKAGKGPNYLLKASDFPLRKLSDPTNRNSAVLSDTNDVVSSAGVALRQLDRKGTIEIPSPVSSNDFDCDIDTSYQKDTTFNVAHANTRRVEPRNTPSVINAVFNHRNFWDGHAQSTFNGVNTKGSFDTDAHLYKLDASLTGPPIATKVQIENSSLASQATAPPGSNTEQGITGRSFLKLGKKLIKCKPLAGQYVAPDDSVLGKLSLYNVLDQKGQHRTGIKKASYKQMIREAFKPEWWSSTYKIQVNADGTEAVVSAGTAKSKYVYTVEEYNFSMFFGLAVQAYQATLVSDETPWDKFNACDPLSVDFSACKSAALSGDVLAGAELFNSPRTRCANCHRGSALTDASVSQIFGSVTNSRKLGLTRLRTFETYAKDINGKVVLKNRQTQLTDTGFNNIGVRPTLEDLGMGGKLNETTDISIARRCTNPADCNLTQSACFNLTPAVLAVDGAMKIPGLRNVALTAPYFHNGGTATLTDVVDFYLRGGDFHPTDVWDTQRVVNNKIFPLVASTGVELDITAERRDPLTCLPTSTTPLDERALTAQERDQIVSFMKFGLTDPRVVNRQAPFDHPQLYIANGHPGDENAVVNDGTGYATDSFLEIPMVGKGGGAPLPTFLNFK